MIVVALLQAANAAGSVGVFLIGRRKRIGWVIAFSAEVFWSAWGFAAHSLSILPWAALWAAIYAGSWWRWRRP